MGEDFERYKERMEEQANNEAQADVMRWDQLETLSIMLRDHANAGRSILADRYTWNDNLGGLQFRHHVARVQTSRQAPWLSVIFEKIGLDELTHAGIWEITPTFSEGVFRWRVDSLHNSYVAEELADQIAIHLHKLEKGAT